MVIRGAYYVAQAYNCDAYGESAFGECAETTSSGSDSSGGLLADTGVGIIALVTLACILIFVGTIIRFMRRSNHTKVSYKKSKG